MIAFKLSVLLGPRWLAGSGRLLRFPTPQIFAEGPCQTGLSPLIRLLRQI